MVVVLKQLAQQQQVERQGVAGVVVVVVVLIAVFVPAPVHDGAMQRPHQKMQGQQQVHPPFGGKKHVKHDICTAPHQAGDPGIAEFVQPVPGGIVAQEFAGNGRGVSNQPFKYFSGVPHHGKYVLVEHGRVWILFGIRKSMVHPVHNGISPGHQVGRALRQVGNEVEDAFPCFIHGEHLVRSVAVVEEGLKEDAGEPMAGEEGKYCHVV